MKKQILLFAFIFASAYNIKAQWIAQNSGTTNNLISVHFVNDNVGYVADVAGYVRKTTNGGLNWSLASNSYLVNGITKILFTSPDTGFAATTGVAKTVDGGITWKNKFTDTTTKIVMGINFPSKNIGYAVAVDLNTLIDTVFIYKTINAGDTWNLILTKLMGCGDIQFTDVATGYVTIDTSLYKTTNGGTSWNAVATNSGYLMDFPSSNIGYSIGGTGNILKTISAGVGPWSQQFNPNTNPLYALDFINSDTGFVGGGNGFSTGIILKTVDGGTNWNLDLTSTETFASIHFPSKNVGYACTSGGKIYKYTSPNGIQGHNQLNNFPIYPNPTKGTCNITIPNDFKNKNNLVLSIYDITGKKIQQHTVQVSQEKVKINLEQEAKGMYNVTLTDGTKMYNGKIVFE